MKSIYAELRELLDAGKVADAKYLAKRNGFSVRVKKDGKYVIAQNPRR